MVRFQVCSDQELGLELKRRFPVLLLSGRISSRSGDVTSHELVPNWFHLYAHEPAHTKEKLEPGLNFRYDNYSDIARENSDIAWRRCHDDAKQRSVAWLDGDGLMGKTDNWLHLRFEPSGNTVILSRMSKFLDGDFDELGNLLTKCSTT